MAGKGTGNRGGGQQASLQRMVEAAAQHHAAGRLAQAEQGYRQVLQAAPEHPVALHLLGVVAHQTGNNATAVDLISRSLATQPAYAEARNNLGNVLSAMGRWEEAAASFQRVLSLKPDWPGTHYNLGNALKGLGRLEEAAAAYRQAIALRPDYADAHNNLGVVLKDLGRPEAAVESYRQALAARPDYADAHNNLGNLLREQGRLTEAAERYEQVLAQRPDDVEAHAGLAEAHARAHRVEDLRAAVARARRQCTAHPRLALAEARLLKLDGDYAGARAILEAAGEEVADPGFRTARAHLLGELCDRLGDTDAAFAYYASGNGHCREAPRSRQADKGRYLARIAALQGRFTADWVAGWRPLAVEDDRPDPVFMVGFPRSGTTLLDTILRSHAGIVVLEERPMVVRMRAALAALPGGEPDGLAGLDAAGLAALRRAYFEELDRHLGPDARGKVVVDKLPLNLVEAGAIQRAFPRARFVFVQRHPCDCVLSCFMQYFQVNDAMASFLDIGDAARLYDAAMGLWQHYREVLPLAVHTVRYERLVEAFDETVLPLLEFLGVAWDDGVRGYAETARRRQDINTPSYGQVTQPLYTRSRGRWERYRAHMVPALPRLLPWARTFGYDD